MKFQLLVFLACVSTAMAGDFSRLCESRTAIERVYYNHRLGDKPPFEQTLPRESVERLVRVELRKESALKQIYHMEITPSMVQAEVQRIQTTTRDAGTLAELKTALGDDPARFAETVARPIVVERELRRRFENDDQIHAPERHAVEQTRDALLAAQGSSVDDLVQLLKRGHSNEVREITWQLTSRPQEKGTESQELAEVKKRFGPDAQIISPIPQNGGEQKFYLDEVPADLQNVLRVQLRQPGDISAVIETPESFLLYVTIQKTDAVLQVAGWTLFKRSYEQWLDDAAASTLEHSTQVAHE